MRRFIKVIAILILSGCASVQRGPSSVVLKPMSQWELDQAFLSSQLYIFAGNNERAAQVLENAVIRAPASKSLDFKMMLAKVEEDLGRFEVAHERYQELLKEHPESEVVLRESAQFYYGIQLKPESYRLYSKLVKMNPSYSNYWIYRGLLALELANAKAAWESFNYLIKKSKDAKHLGHLYMGKLMQMTSFDRKAETEFSKCLKVKNESKECSLELARLKRSQNKLESSKGILKKFLEKFKIRGNKEIAEQLFSWMVQEGKEESAIKLLKKMERSYPADLNVKRRLSALMAKNKNFEGSLERMSLIVKNDAATEKDHLNYVSLLKESGDEVRAYDFISSKVSMSKAKEKTFFIRHEMDVAELGRAKAEKKLTSLCFKTVNKKDCLYVHAYVMWKSGKFERAQKSLRSALRKKGSDFNKYSYFLSQMYYEDNQEKRALKVIDSILRKDREYTPALNFKAYHLVEKGGDLLEAEKLSLLAVSLEPGNGHYLDTYGYVLLKKNQFKEALVVLKEAFKFMPDEPEVVEHLADAYKKMNNIKMAVRFYTLASNLYKGENRKRIGGKIAQIKTQRSISSVPDGTDVPNK